MNEIKAGWKLPSFYIIFLLTACASPHGRISWPEKKHVENYVKMAMPTLEARCGNPGCHGNAKRPFSLYTLRRYRLDPANQLADLPLTEEEQYYNFLQTVQFVSFDTDAKHSLLLLKPLAVGAGGAEHLGGDIFPSDQDYGYRSIARWIELYLAEGGR